MILATSPLKEQAAELFGNQTSAPAFAFSHTVPASLRAPILAALPARVLSQRSGATALSALAVTSSGAGRYALRTETGDWFVRVTARWGNPALETAIMSKLVQDVVPINPIVASGIPVSFADGTEPLRLDVRPLLADAGHFSGTDAELTSFGHALAAAHASLKTFDDTTRVRAAAEIRYARWHDLNALAGAPNDLARCLPPYAEWIVANARWIAETAATCPLGPLLDIPEAQCLHGEPHLGNVLFQDGQAVLLDFEESVHLHAARAWDLAFAVQRFMLADDPSADLLHRRLAAFEAGYGDAACDPQAMRTVAWTTLLAIFDLWRNECIVTPTAELDKFRRLERQGRTVERML